MSLELKRYHEKADGGMFEAVDGYCVRYADVATRPQPAEAKDAGREALPERPITSLAYVAQLSADQALTVQRIVKEMDAYADALEAALQSTPPAGGEG